MRQAWRGLALLAVGALTMGGSVARAHDGGGHGNGNGNGNGALATTIFTMPAADGNPEGVAFDERSGRFFVSRTGTGAIFTGTLDNPALQPFIAGGTATGSPLATGLKVRKGLLYVAGASTGEVRVYDIADPAKAPIVFQTGGTFVNDLDLDSHGNVFATDSSKSFVYMIPAAAVAAGGGAVVPIDLSASIKSDPAAFNLNGIVVKGHDELILVQSNTGQLWRVTFGGRDAGDDHGDDSHARAAQAATPAPKVEEIKVDGGPVTGGDGLLLDRGRLLVVRGTTTQNANGAVDVVKLRHHRTRGEVQSEFSDPSFAGPSTIARARNLLLVVNANFAGTATATQFTVSGVARNGVRGGHGGHGGDGGGHGGDGGRHGGDGGGHGGDGGGHGGHG
jgi:sugar lactone lactonase YvrE